MKMSDLRHRILRIGSARSVHPDMLDRTPEYLLSKSSGGLSDLVNLVSNARIVGATCLGAATSPLLQARRFDVCIVDEAGQITLPTCLGPLHKVISSFVLIGDENQLPPLVRSENAQQGGLSVSLFERLAKEHPPAVSQLRFQYVVFEREDLLSFNCSEYSLVSLTQNHDSHPYPSRTPLECYLICKNTTRMLRSNTGTE